MRIVLWAAVLAGAVLSLQLSYGVATQSVIVGAREGRWVYGYLQPFAWRTVIVFTVAFVGMLAVMRATASEFAEREWVWLLVWFVAAIGVEGLICWLAPFDFARIFASDGANSFYSVADRYGPATMLGDFERVRTYWAPHAQSNMPGKAILVYWLRRISRDPGALAWLVLVVSNVGGLFLYGIARDLFDRRTAQYAFLLYIVTPGKMFFFPLLNTVTPAFVLLAAWLFTRWMLTRNVVYAGLFGASIYAVVLFEPLGLAIGGFVLGLLAWGIARAGMHPSTLAWQGALSVGAFGATYAGVFARWGFNMAPIVGLLAGDAIKFNVAAQRPYDVWVRQNLVDFVIALGACQAFLVAGAMLDGLMTGGSLRHRVTTPAFVVAASLVGVLLVTDVIGVTRGEVVRLWIFIACALQLPAAYVCARLHNPFAFIVVLAVTLLHGAVGTAMIGFILPG